MKNGFTLVELLIALVIVGILMAVAVPNYADYVLRSRRAEARVALVESMQQQERYYTRHNTYAAYSADDPHPGFRWWSGPGAGKSAYELAAAPCQGAGLAECVELRAIPGTAKVDALFADPECGALFLRSDGRRGALGRAAGCWP
ncbi:MAG TPA: type IV pilin protein [Telluria sp.]|nr:type IV pilin protein [Telluria sp.]